MNDGLSRSVSLIQAVFLGLGSIVGSGVFVSLGLAAGLVGPALVLALFIAALLATINGLASAQLAANYPVSGGTYVYASRLISPTIGFGAGALFLIAKSASAATAALGFGAYFSRLFGLSTVSPVAIAALATLIMTALAATGLKRSVGVNAILVIFLVSVLLTFTVAGFLLDSDKALSVVSEGKPIASPFYERFGEAVALLFVAFTGYGRLATLGEEIHNPRRTIPIAMVVTLGISFLLYSGVAIAALMILGSEGFFESAAIKGAPLAVAASRLELPLLPLLINAGAMTALLGVLLNIILGLSRVVLAMSRQGDFPRFFAQLNPARTSPARAVWVSGLAVLLLVSLGGIPFNWALSAFTVLAYYGCTNWCALKLSKSQRLYPRMLAWMGLIFCLYFALWIEPVIMVGGILLLAFALSLRWILKRGENHGEAPLD